MASPSRKQTPRRYAAFVAAIALHALALAALGLMQPTVTEPDLPGAPTMQVSLLPSPEPRRRTAVVRRAITAAAPQAARPPALQPSPSLRAAIPSDAQPEPIRPAAPDPGCEREVLILLTPAEKARCRNQLDAETARKIERNAGAEAARRVQEARRTPALDSLAPEKRAEYDAIQQAKAARREDFTMKGLPGRDGLQVGNDSIDINIGVRCTMSLDSGRGLKLGRPSCRVAPPGGGVSTGRPP